MTDVIKKESLLKSVVFLRILIGWHFLYEGVIKLFNPDWTAFGYLATAQGPFKSVFIALTNEATMGWVDTLNTLVLIFVGVTLILGIFEKWGAIAGIGLLALYYFAHPPFPWLEQQNVEGSYWFVNKNLIEIAALWILAQLPTGHYFGLQYLFKKEPKTIKTPQS
ncbi:MAG: DoxX family membrane protein [Muriicola sp.]|nr:DoxX family membrane protein [Muriicola sp.]NNC62288.1 DoxX family membrane protein [Eudoraea sp.]NNK20464.1 DoxX family membrane protein [Flavobacteriaceae bacterium]NNK36392.1 DoxX family membrane protein [Eudoraea sp.]